MLSLEALRMDANFSTSLTFYYDHELHSSLVKRDLINMET
jgi:hypothetical protein